MAIVQWVQLDYGRAEISLYAWASEAHRISTWNVKDEFPAELLVCEGTSNGEALIQLLGDKPDGKIFLLSDGFWSRNDMKTLRRWQEELPPGTLSVITIGADANSQLRAQLRRTDVFISEDFFAVLDGLLEGGLV